MVKVDEHRVRSAELPNLDNREPHNCPNEI